MASMTASLCAAPAVALSVSASASTSTGARAQLAAPALKSRTVSKPLEWANKTVSNGSRVNAFNVVNPNTNIKYETLSYLPPLTDDQILKQVEYLLQNGWIPALEFDKCATVSRGIPPMPNAVDGRYWTMWKLPLFGAKDASQVLNEVQEAKTAYPDAFIRVIGFDSKRQVQVISFIVYKPKGF